MGTGPMRGESKLMFQSRCVCVKRCMQILLHGPTSKDRQKGIVTWNPH